MVKLNLRQNALHTLHHAVEHLYWADSDSSEPATRSFDHENHVVEWRVENGRPSFSVYEFTRPPASYNLKFALLHLIQASELLLKSYVESADPTAILVRSGSQRTISFRAALDFVVGKTPGLLSRDEVSLLLQAKDLRNEIEHYEFHFGENNLRQICTDFLALCSLLCVKVLHISVVDAFSWDYLHDRPDPVGNHLSRVLADISDLGRLSAAKAGTLWAAENPKERVFVCLNCGARSVSVAQGTCMGCGVEGDEHASQLVEELEIITARVNELKATRFKR